MEILGAFGLGLGGLISLIAWIWLVIIAFKEGGAIWGIVVFFLAWIGGLVFCLMHQKGWAQLVLMVLGVFLSTAGVYFSFPAIFG